MLGIICVEIEELGYDAYVQRSRISRRWLVLGLKWWLVWLEVGGAEICATGVSWLQWKLVFLGMICVDTEELGSDACWLCMLHCVSRKIFVWIVGTILVVSFLTGLIVLIIKTWSVFGSTFLYILKTFL